MVHFPGVAQVVLGSRGWISPLPFTLPLSLSLSLHPLHPCLKCSNTMPSQIDSTFATPPHSWSTSPRKGMRSPQTANTKESLPE
ncbi:uncharacterized protein BO66DRAFT_248740 [Aspergillus aculeatinus CBS 121060]|uniref:Uncharacterized protein n=1 Tax=Aspergillus aculeatinus CBS 121060 TaxID=1448322 RepID=A0ACD1HH03_9EURO|nr:hypothetical protein BO66DRAFT_248740 [Aspergillus aculeatinus CBS 121060]RAH72840.1 hypothetical protein BO66DRAFT_248740 [Aspergillus aculeatinus CBS 121060]